VELRERVAVDPAIRFGKPCIRGTRIAVDDILELLQSGVSFDGIRSTYYPGITPTDIAVCVAYARAVISNEELHLSTPDSCP
jgi:uncharacterized protein (DUF433 family)